VRPLTVSESLRCEMLGACFYGIAHFLSEPTHRKRHPLTFDKAVVEPGRARRRHLQVEIDVRAVGEHQGRPGIAGPPNRRTPTMPPAGGASAKASIPRKRTW
jgi:hypothetical protein